MIDASPQPSPLERISPTTAATLHLCGYRVAWDRDPRVPEPAKSAKTVLGTVGHKVCELAGEGALGPVDDGWDDRFDEAWDAELERCAAEHPALGPPEAWPTTILDQELWRTPARHAALNRGQTTVSTASSNSLRTGREVVLKGFGGRLIGVADVILPDGIGSVEIHDFKSGRVLGESGELLDAYRRQLLLYAALYHDEHGVWPSKLMIYPLTRGPIKVEPDQVEARRLVEETLREVAQFNAAIEAGTTAQLARPAPYACRFCAHLQRCEAFWKAADPSWEGRPPALAGEVIEEDVGAIYVTVSDGTVHVGEVRVGGIGRSNARVGDRVRVTWFERRSAGEVALGDAGELAVDGQRVDAS